MVELINYYLSSLLCHLFDLLRGNAYSYTIFNQNLVIMSQHILMTSCQNDFRVIQPVKSVFSSHNKKAFLESAD